MNKGPVKALTLVISALFVAVLSLYAFHTMGTTPAEPATMEGSFAIQAADGSSLLSLDVAGDGTATAVFRGIEMKGTLSREMTTQTGATYKLGIEESSVGDPEQLQFSIQVPPEGTSGDLTGTWYIRFRNLAQAQDDGSDGTVLNLLGFSKEDVWYAQYNDATAEDGEDAEPPYEVFDFFTLSPDGTGSMLNEQFIPLDLSDAELQENGRPIQWSQSNGTLVLREG